ncbi:MAG TPA: lmo0937 family membrane protein [Ktedonobacterales bacterium]
MLWTIALVLFVLWILGFVVFHVTSFLIHVLLLVAIIVLMYYLVAGRRSRGTV